MSTVSMVPYTGAGMAGNALGDTDATALNIGFITPGGVADLLEVYWVNTGDTGLTDPTLSIVAHPSSDSGAAADGENVMALLQSGAGNLLGSGTPATPTNTSGWAGAAPFGAMPNPFPNTGASITDWKCGIRWSPQAGAGLGTVRKGFRWTGTF